MLLMRVAGWVVWCGRRCLGRCSSP